jgi:hypothetical protein
MVTAGHGRLGYGALPSVRVPLCCNVSGPCHDHFKHEEDGAGPKMAKRLEVVLNSSQNA